MKASRYVLNEVNKRFPTFPFTIRAFEDEKQARMGVVEMERSDMLHSYPVMFEKDGVTTAHFKFTILLLPSGTTKVTGLDLPPYVEADDQRK
jgi:methionine aminopeptidase